MVKVKTLDSTIGQYQSKENLETKLMKNFLESIEEEPMKSLVEKISLPYEVLSHYTSILEECAIEFHHCKNCKGLAACKNKVTGYAYLPHVKENYLDFEYQACKYEQKRLKEESHLTLMKCYEIPKEIRNACMKDIYTDDENRFEAIKAMNHFLKEYPNCKGIYLYGSFGSGKTYLLSALFHEFANRKIKSAIVFWPDYLRDLKNSFNGDKDEFKNKYNAVMKTPLLLIDDIGAENTTAWGRDEIFCPIMQYRMQEHLPTFFTSNLDLKALEQHFSITKDGVDVIKARRIIERIKQMAEPVEMVSKNLRK